MCGFQCRYGLLALDGRKRVKKLFKAVAAFQIVNQISEGDTRSDEHGDAAKNFRIAVDQGSIYENQRASGRRYFTTAEHAVAAE